MLREIGNNFKTYKLSDDVKNSELIKYEFNRDNIFNRKNNIWGTVFDKQIAPKISTIAESLKDKKIIAIPLLGLRNMSFLKTIMFHNNSLENFSHDPQSHFL